jgi:uncharacterized protein (TIGR00730 family)
MLGSVCVFCGSAAGADPIYREMAERLAETLFSRDITLIYGGANVGLMRFIADTMLEQGGRVTGVMPESLVEKEVAHTGLTTMHIVKTIQERKALMAELSDAFIALPGGYGTFDELFEMLSWNQLKLIRKPVGILNISRYFNPLIRQLDRAVEERFLRAEHRDMLIADTDPENLIRKLETFIPVEAEKWIDRLKEGNI